MGAAQSLLLMTPSYSHFTGLWHLRGLKSVVLASMIRDAHSWDCRESVRFEEEVTLVLNMGCWANKVKVRVLKVGELRDMELD